MFHQVEGLVIDEETHLGHLKWVLEEFCKAFFEVREVKMRFRASHFPFTEPSMEVDIGYAKVGDEIRIGEGDQWLEILGCGMVHPNVLKNVGLDPERYQGFAFGMGIDRIAMLKYGMPDLRAFFAGDLRWLKHYGFRLIRGADTGRRAWPVSHEVHPLLAQGSSRHQERASTRSPRRSPASGSRSRRCSIRRALSATSAWRKWSNARSTQTPTSSQVCEVDTGTERLQVVCGAPNARPGLKGVFAPVGSYVPGIDLTLTKAKIRGVESNGMLLSERELELSDEHTGIIELAADAKVGSPAAKALGLDDAVFEVAITPNRPDCLGVRGIARDLAAAGLGKLKTDTVKPVKGSFANPLPIKLDFDKESAAPARSSPDAWSRASRTARAPTGCRRRLKAIGLRPINALVDITNYIAYDRGRPLHVYDADKTRRARSARGLGERARRFKALDGKTYEVDDDMCVIADDRWRARARRRDGRRRHRRRRESHHQRLHRVGLFRSEAHGADRTEAQHSVRRALQIRARRRSRTSWCRGSSLPRAWCSTFAAARPSKVEIAGKPPKPNAPFKFDPASSSA